MQATGIVRRIDDLGRIIIPKEIRRRLELDEGAPMEIFVDHRYKTIVLEKYSQFSSIHDQAKIIAQSLFGAIQQQILVVDLDQVLCVVGGKDRNCIDKQISSGVAQFIQQRFVGEINHTVSLFKDDPDSDDLVRTCFPIVIDSEPIGGLIVCSQKKLTDVDFAVAEVMADTLKRLCE